MSKDVDIKKILEEGEERVLYICADKCVLRALLEVDKEVSDCHRCSPKLYFTLLADATGAIVK